MGVQSTALEMLRMVAVMDPLMEILTITKELVRLGHLNTKQPTRVPVKTVMVAVECRPTARLATKLNYRMREMQEVMGQLNLHMIQEPWQGATTPHQIWH